jgi:hypothetical protein
VPTLSFFNQYRSRELGELADFSKSIVHFRVLMEHLEGKFQLNTLKLTTTISQKFVQKCERVVNSCVVVAVDCSCKRMDGLPCYIMKQNLCSHPSFAIFQGGKHDLSDLKNFVRNQWTQYSSSLSENLTHGKKKQKCNSQPSERVRVTISCLYCPCCYRTNYRTNSEVDLCSVDLLA